MAAYRAETKLVQLVDPRFARDEDEGRRLIKEAWTRATVGEVPLDDVLRVFGGVDAKKNGWFLGGSVEAGYRLDLNDCLTARVQGGGSMIAYDGLSKSDTDSGYLSAGADATICDCFSVHLDGRFSHYWIDGRNYSNVWTVAPSGTVRWQDWTSTTLAYAFSNDIVFREPSLNFVDADTHTHAVTLSQYVKVPCTRLVVTPYLQYAWVESDGSEFRHEALSARITLRHPLVCGIDAVAGFDYRRAWYEERSIFSGDFSEDRDDNVYGFSAHVERRFGEHAMVFVEGSWSTHDSDVLFYDYQRDVYTFGVELGF